jgi:hypothetical protein
MVEARGVQGLGCYAGPGSPDNTACAPQAPDSAERWESERIRILKTCCFSGGNSKKQLEILTAMKRECQRRIRAKVSREGGLP